MYTRTISGSEIDINGTVSLEINYDWIDESGPFDTEPEWHCCIDSITTSYFGTPIDIAISNENLDTLEKHIASLDVEEEQDSTAQNAFDNWIESHLS